MGCCNVNIAYKGQTAVEMLLLIVEGSGPSLFGRNWLNQIILDWRAIHSVSSNSLQVVLDKYPSVFQEGLGTLRGYKAKIHVDPNAPPKFYKARTVPYALREKVEAELQRLQEEGTLEPVEIADWAAPIVPVLKSDKSSVRICEDFRLTVNPVSKLDTYPIPKVEDLFTRLRKGKAFTKLDLSQVYQQLPLEESSKRYVVINTHKGLFRYTRLPYGISSAPGIFQRVIENVLQDIPGVVTYLDDILITGSSDETHLETLEEVLRRLDKAGLRVKLKKCEFMRPSVTYLGHKIDETGLHPLLDKIRAIQEAPTPQSVSELKSYLGLLTYYGKFFPNMSSTLCPLYRLLRKDQLWEWHKEQEKAFNESRKSLTSSNFLAHLNSDLPLLLACDASAYGIGAVLAHRMPDGTERPIGYTSRTLTKAEQNYSQLEKEGLSCVFGIRKFHNYLFGHHFQLITDHKPLLGLLKEHRPVNPQASARIKRWSLFLSAYEYELVFRDTKAHSNADALSRLPLPVIPAKTETPPELVLLAEHSDQSPVTAMDIRNWTRRDPELLLVLQFLLQGWPTNYDPGLEIFASKKMELSIYNGCILWGSRVVVSKPGRDSVLQELHEGHPRISKMKALARMYVWWPRIDSDIEKSVRMCSACQEVQSSPSAAPLNPWQWPSRPWTRLHLDFAGPLENRMFLILIDAHTKWIEATCTSQATSAVVIQVLRSAFARFGLPETIVTDNASCFTSEEFKSFLKGNGIRHTTSAPYHPASNGLAEWAVQIVKRGLKKVSAGDINTRLAKVLFSYRISPHSTTGISPSELLLGRRPRTRLDLLKPQVAENVENRQFQQKVWHDKTAKARVFEIGELVFVKSHNRDCNWLPGKITKVTGPSSYHVSLSDGRERRCHVDQLRARLGDSSLIAENPEQGADLSIPNPSLNEDSMESVPATETSEEARLLPTIEPIESQQTPINSGSPTQTQSQTRVYPTRTRAPPKRYDPSWNN